MAHKKGQGSSRNGRDSKPKYLGVKRADGQHILAGGIILRQRGTKIHPGMNTGLGRDHTIFAKVEGTVHFTTNKFNKKVAEVIAAANA